jgi:hypothetical protein
MRGILLRRQGEGENIELAVDRLQVIQEWWDFLTVNNPLFSDYLERHAVPLQPPSLVNPPIMEGAEIQELFVPEEQAIQEELTLLVPAMGVGPHEPGPWLDVADQVLGVDAITREEITLSNPSLFGLLFPWLFPFGTGFFRLKMARTRLRDPQEVAWPIITLKEYAKYVLSSCDRRWALDAPFAAMLYDMLLKERLYSGPMRTVGPTTANRPTRVADILRMFVQ